VELPDANTPAEENAVSAENPATAKYKFYK